MGLQEGRCGHRQMRGHSQTLRIPHQRMRILHEQTRIPRRNLALEDARSALKVSSSEWDEIKDQVDTDRTGLQAEGILQCLKS